MAKTDKRRGKPATAQTHRHSLPAFKRCVFHTLAVPFAWQFLNEQGQARKTVYLAIRAGHTGEDARALRDDYARFGGEPLAVGVRHADGTKEGRSYTLHPFHQGKPLSPIQVVAIANRETWAATRDTTTFCEGQIVESEARTNG